MPVFGKESERQLRTCDPRLQKVLRAVIEDFDMRVLEGHRGEAAQNKAFDEGKSKLRWPNGKHNKYPSNAVDVVPYVEGKPIDWKDREAFFFMAGLILATAKAMGIKLRWGGNWDGGALSDQSFDDLPHFEVLG